MSHETFHPEEFTDPDFESVQKPQRSFLEVVELRKKLRMAASVLSEGNPTKIIPGQGWAMGLSQKFKKERQKNPNTPLHEIDPKLLIPDTMTFPEQDLVEKSEEFIFGVLRHEYGHLHHSDYLSLLEGQEWATKEGYQAADCQMFYNAWEDGRSNEMEGRESDSARYQLGSYLKEDLIEVLGKNLSSRPLPIQYGMLCWAKGAMPLVDGFDMEQYRAQITDQRVLDAYDRTEPVLDEYLVTADARRAFRDVLWKRAWPAFKELIDAGIEDDAKKRYQDDQKKSEDADASGSSGAEDQSGGPAGNKKGVPPTGEPKDTPWEKASEETKQRYREEARGGLTEEEKKIIQLLMPKSVPLTEEEDGSFSFDPEQADSRDILDASAETEAEFEIQKEIAVAQIQQNIEEENRKNRDLLERIRARSSELSPYDRQMYQNHRNSVRKLESQFKHKIEKLFPPVIEEAWQGGKTRGRRIDHKSLAREIAIGRGRMFETKDAGEAIKKPGFKLLIDVSGSMHGEKIEAALDAGILMSEVFSDTNIPFSIDAFNGEYHEIKKFTDEYRGAQKAELLRILRMVFEEAGQYNDDGYAVDRAARSLQQYTLRHGILGALTVFSDGQPHPTYAHSGFEWELKTIVDKWSKRLPVLGVGIGYGMEGTIKRYYGSKGISVPNVEALPRQYLGLLGREVKKMRAGSIRSA